jgi:hypothetical protein
MSTNVRHAHIKSRYPVMMFLLFLDDCGINISYSSLSIIYTESRWVNDEQDEIPSWHNKKCLHLPFS